MVIAQLTVSQRLPRLVALMLTFSLGAVTLCACTQLSFAVANLPAHRGSFERHSGVHYATGPRGELDVYAPNGAKSLPVIVFFYGGSWQHGSRKQYRFVGAALAEAGYVVVLPDYRLYPEVRFPEFNADAARAVVWAHQHAAEIGGDATKLFIMGHSAGAHIAASVALDSRYLLNAGGQMAWIRGLIGLSGPYVLKPNTLALKEIFAAPYAPADWQLQNFVTTASPAALLVHGGKDDLVSPANSEELTRVLREHGVAAQLWLVPNRGHADILGALSVPARRRARTLDYVKAFVDARCAQIDLAK